MRAVAGVILILCIIGWLLYIAMPQDIVLKKGEWHCSEMLPDPSLECIQWSRNNER